MNTNTVSESPSAKALHVIRALADAIRELESIPSGHLYARVMGQMTLDQYNLVIGILKRAGLVSEVDHLLTWSGPPSGSPQPL